MDAIVNQQEHHTEEASVAKLSDDDRTLVLSFIDALVTKTRLKRLTADIS